MAKKREKKPEVFSDKGEVLRGSILATITFVALSLGLILIGKFPITPPVEGGFGFAEWQEVQAEETAWLSNYDWVDEDEGIVRMSIRDTMRLIVDEEYLAARAAEEEEEEAEASEDDEANEDEAEE